MVLGSVRGGLLLRRVAHLLLYRRLLILGSASSHSLLRPLVLSLGRHLMRLMSLLLILALLLLLLLVLSLRDHRRMGLSLLRIRLLLLLLRVLGLRGLAGGSWYSTLHSHAPRLHRCRLLGGRCCRRRRSDCG